jgi:hypothetical protein
MKASGGQAMAGIDEELVSTGRRQGGDGNRRPGDACDQWQPLAAPEGDEGKHQRGDEGDGRGTSLFQPRQT